MTSATWDLDTVADRNDWTLDVVDNPTGAGVRDLISNTGTAVVWER